MTLEEAIKHAEEVASEYRNTMVCGFNSTGTLVALPEGDCIKCAEEHEQLAEWLKELAALRAERPKGHWVTYDELHCLRYCSNCRNGTEYKWHYCPRCGADMREGGQP